MICGPSIRARLPALSRGCPHESDQTSEPAALAQSADRHRPPADHFFLVNFLAPVPGAIKIFVATGAFMAAMVAALDLCRRPLPLRLAAAAVLARSW